MKALLGFEPDMWDYLTFLTLFLCVAVFLVFLIWMAGMPGRIAIARKHPDAEAVKVMGYLGFVPIVPWIQAFIWAFKPTEIVDIRRFPAAEAKAIDEDIARLSGRTVSSAKTEAPPPKTEMPAPPGNRIFGENCARAKRQPRPATKRPRLNMPGRENRWPPPRPRRGIWPRGHASCSS